MKKIFFLTIGASLIFCSLYIIANTSSPEKSFNAEELAEFDGQDGAKAYVAVDGTVYDVTPVEAWKGGKHKAGIRAGRDLSKKITQSPHGKKVLNKLPKVGVYSDN